MLFLEMPRNLLVFSKKFLDVGKAARPHTNSGLVVWSSIQCLARRCDQERTLRKQVQTKIKPENTTCQGTNPEKPSGLWGVGWGGRRREENLSETKAHQGIPHKTKATTTYYV